MKRRKGIFLMDAIVGLIVLGTIAGILAVAMNGHQTAVLRLADHRAAARLAETTISSLQSGREISRPADSRDKISWRKISAAAPVGMEWMQVDATVNGSSERLVGLMPADVAGGER